MKKIRITLYMLSAIFCFVLVNNTQSFAQVHHGDVVLSSQAEVNAFTCNEIIGSLTITGSDITNLNNLSTLRKVSGALRIANNPNLSSLDTLVALDSIGENLSLGNPALTVEPEALIIENNASLLHCDRLSSVHSIRGGLRIAGNSSLVSMNGFQYLHSVGWIDVSDNSNLIEMTGFEISLATVSSRSGIPGSITIRQNDNLFVLRGFSALYTVGDIRIVNNTRLAIFEGFNSLNVINGYLEISGNRSLSYLSSFGAVTNISGFPGFGNPSGLIIANNSTLRSFTGLASLKKITSEVDAEISIFDNPSLENIDGLASLTSLSGQVKSKLKLHNNPSLGNVDGLSSLALLESSEGGLYIEVTQNPALVSCCGLRPLIQYLDRLGNLGALMVTGNVNISGNGGACTPFDILAGPPCVKEVCGGNYIVLSSQAEVDAFMCTEVIGNLTISGSDITNLNSLSSLTRVSQNLRLEGNINLQTLDGLSSLEYVGEQFNILNNRSLSDISMLSSLQTVGSLMIDSTQIDTLDGFSSLRAANSIRVANNHRLLHISGFDSVGFTNGIDIINNQALTAIDAFNGLTGSTILIAGNARLLAIDGFRSLERANNFSITNNESLESINGFENLNYVGNPNEIGTSFRITDNASLETFNGLSSLKTISNPYLVMFSISNNHSLKNFDGFASLTSIYGSRSTELEIVNNEMLEDVNALSKVVTSLQVKIKVTKNPSLTSCCGLRKILSDLDAMMLLDDVIASGDVNISDNGAGCTVEDIINGLPCFKKPCDDVVLTSQAAVDSFTCTDVAGTLTITGNDITNLNPLSNLRSAGSIVIRNNSQLKILGGFSSLTHVDGSITISENPELSEISGFDSLQTLESGVTATGGILISYNAKLRALDNFNALQDVYSISIIENNSLTSINGFSSLTQARNVEVLSNLSLLTIDGFSSLQFIRGGLTISSNTSLKSFIGFQRVTRMMAFTINGNSSLSELDGLSGLKTLGGNDSDHAGFAINDNSSLKNLDGLASLTTVGEDNIQAVFGISNNAVLESIDGISGLRFRNSDFSKTAIYLTDNPTLTNCCSLFHIINDLGEDGISKASFAISNNGGGCTLSDILTGGSCQTGNAIVGFDIIDKRSGDVVIAFSNDSVTLDFSDPQFRYWEIRANTRPQQVGSVEFRFAKRIKHIENVFPYTFSLPDHLAPGTYSVAADVYAEARARGEKGIGRIATISIINPAAVVGFDIVDTSGKFVRRLSDGDFIDIRDLKRKGTTIVANTTGWVGSVGFEMNNHFVRVENVFPYTLTGDNYGAYFYPWIAQPGRYVLTATPYAGANASGATGRALTIHFRVAGKHHAAGQRTAATDSSAVDYGREKAALSVYPVPAEDELNVEIDDQAESDAVITVRNIEGVTVYNDFYSKSRRINTRDFLPGVYFLHVVGYGQFYNVVKFIKK